MRFRRLGASFYTGVSIGNTPGRLLFSVNLYGLLPPPLAPCEPSPEGELS